MNKTDKTPAPAPAHDYDRHKTLLCFDIETGPVDRNEVLEFAQPFPPFTPPAPFDPASVKTGNIKDAAKIAEKVEAERQKYEQEAATAEQRWEAEKAAHEARVVEQAALSPLTGQVLCIGYVALEFNGPGLAGATVAAWVDAADEGDGGEAGLLARFWSVTEGILYSSAGRMVGWNIAGFDVPFLITRSWKHGVTVPRRILEKNRYLHPRFVDLMLRFGAGNAGAKFQRLDTAARFFGAPGKDTGTDGATFWKDWTSGDPERRRAALEYVEQDVRLTAFLAKRMGVMRDEVETALNEAAHRGGAR